jgi:hypothetical protein
MTGRPDFHKYKKERKSVDGEWFRYFVVVIANLQSPTAE